MFTRTLRTSGWILSAALFVAAMSAPPPAAADEPIIIDHTCTDLSQVPAYWIEQAKLLTIHYAHTSHGSQVNSGAELLETQHPVYSFARRQSTTEGLPPEEDPPALRMYDGNPPETYINPEDYWQSEDGRNRTRAVADTGHYDFSMWSWCGQLSWYSESAVQEYLDVMTQFEAEYPDMRFILMTGHTDGSGVDGTLNQNNELIRQYAAAHDMVLFDFADIESWDPDGTWYLPLGCNDNGDYEGGNWPSQWCAAHPDSELCDYCSCAHSQAIICNLKGRAFWWMMARLAGWCGSPAGDIDNDGDVDLADLAALLACYDSCTGDAAYNLAADFDGDGCVDLDDLSTLLAHYQQ